MNITVTNKKAALDLARIILHSSKKYSKEYKKEEQLYERVNSWNDDVKDYETAKAIIIYYCLENDICFIDDYGISYKNESIICYPCLDEFEFNLEYMASLYMLLDSEEEPKDYIIYWPDYDEEMLRENQQI